MHLFDPGKTRTINADSVRFSPACLLLTGVGCAGFFYVWMTPMAGDWIKMRTDLGRDPAVIRLAEIYGWEEHVIVGLLHKLWSWADEQVSDGNASVAREFLDRYLGVKGFAENLIKVGWMDETVDGIAFPHWDRHMSKTAKSRVSNTARVAAHRCNASVTKTAKEKVTIPRTIRNKVWARDRECVYCRRTNEAPLLPGETKLDASMSVDHVIPESKGGDVSLNNLVTCCTSCNRFKGDRTPDECGFQWPVDVTGKRYGGVTKSLPEKSREEKSREEGSKESKPKKVGTKAEAVVPLDLSMFDQELQVSVVDWLAYKTERRESYKSRGLKAFFTQITKAEKQHGATAVVNALEVAMGNGWKGWQGKMGQNGKQQTFDELKQQRTAEVVREFGSE